MKCAVQLLEINNLIYITVQCTSQRFENLSFNLRLLRLYLRPRICLWLNPGISACRHLSFAWSIYLNRLIAQVIARVAVSVVSRTCLLSDNGGTYPMQHIRLGTSCRAKCWKQKHKTWRREYIRVFKYFWLLLPGSQLLVMGKYLLREFVNELIKAQVNFRLDFVV